MKDDEENAQIITQKQKDTVPHPSGDLAQGSLTSDFEWDPMS
jgi:hypothetical protein